VIELLTQSPTLVVLDNFETVGSPQERAGCISFLAERASNPALITSRDKVAVPARNIPLKGMSSKEAHEFLDQVIDQTQDAAIFSEQVRNRIIKTAESNPYIMLWMVAQIDEAQTPKRVLDELEQGKGPVAERVFERSFMLQQVGEDGRAALLALSLFVPDASHEALAEVAGFGADLSRVDGAVRNLRRLWLIGTARENERLAVEGLTRSLTKARLSKDEHAKDFRQRFIDCFLSYSQVHAYPTPENFDALEGEKDNVLTAMDAAFGMKDCIRVMQLMDVISFDGVNGYLRIRGYWDEVIRGGEQALKCARDLSDEVQIAHFSHNLAITYQDRGELLKARQLYNESLELNKRLGNQGGISGSLHQLALLAQVQGELEEARRLYNESLEIKKRLGNQGGIAITLHQLASLAHDQGELDEARRLYNESLKILKRLGDQGGIASSLHQLAMLAQDQGELDEARRLYYESLEIKKRLGNQDGLAVTLHQLASLARDQGELDEARRLSYESLEIKKRLGNQRGIASSLHQLARLAQDQGELEEARRLYNESLEIRKRLGNQSGIAITLHGLGSLAEDEDDNAEAARLFAEALAIFEKLKSPNATIVRASLARVRGESSE
jgi:tetratricopeptide (TPR) repeat protein